MIERHGFDAVWVIGSGVATMQHALPDLNITAMTETLPVIADRDRGFGGLLTVVRTVTELERAGVSTVSTEDHHLPERNGLFTGEAKRKLIPTAERARRFRAATAARGAEDSLLPERRRAPQATVSRSLAWVVSGGRSV